jgi:glycosyltransferase involved in cell wall biosynthesis
MKPKVLMVGTALDGQGGVASVLRTWRDQELFELWGVRFEATNGSGGNLQKLWLALRAWLRCAWAMAFDGVVLVHVHTSSYISFWRKTPVFALALLLRRPLLVSLHGGGFRDFYVARGPLGKAWIRMVMRRALRFIVLTEEWRRWVAEVEPRSRVCVIPNPAPCVPPMPIDRSVADADLLLFLGRIERDKGIFVLLEALALARSEGAAWRLICGGNGDLKLAQLAAKDLGLGPDQVQFLGWIDGDTKRQWLERCAMLVLPSFIENMPVAILEAFAYGKPVIATRVGGVPDVVTPDIDGFLVDAGDGAGLAAVLQAAYVDPHRLQLMGLQGREKVEAKYAPHRVMAQVDGLYRECMPAAMQGNGGSAC